MHVLPIYIPEHYSKHPFCLCESFDLTVCFCQKCIECEERDSFQEAHEKKEGLRQEELRYKADKDIARKPNTGLIRKVRRKA